MHFRFQKKYLLGALVLLGILAGQAASLNHLFTDDMVLQRNKPVRIYGAADTKDESITVSFGNQTKKTEARDGFWDVWLEPMEADEKGQTLTVEGAGTSVSIENILVGDVWLLTGQSNMARPFKAYAGLAPIVREADHPQIRIAYVDPPERPRVTKESQPLLEEPVLRHTKWYPCVYEGAEEEARKLLNDLSPPGYFFATNLMDRIDVPIGLVMACRGATKALWWTPEGVPEQFPELQRYVDEDDPDASYLYNAVIHPVRKFTVRGILWYQGEGDNALPEEYGALFPHMIDAWRRALDEKVPFLFASLSSYGFQTESWPYVRESQAKALTLPKTGMIMTYDVGDYADIHPADKQTVGYRFYMKAREVVYGEDIISSGPVYDHFSVNGDQAVVSFRNVGGGLVTKEVSMPKNREKTEFITVEADQLAGFEVCGPDRVFYPADAEIRGKDTVIVRNENVNSPVAVRYAWASFALANLFNKEGFPAEVFRTDHFPVPRYAPLVTTGKTVAENDPDWGQPMTIARKHGESSVAPVMREWRAGWQIDKPRFSMMYFSAPDPSFAEGAEPRIQLTVVYFDEGDGSFFLKYDSSDPSVRAGKNPPGVWKWGAVVKLTGTQTWKACTFDIQDAFLAGRCHGEDLRLDNLPEGIVIGDVYIKPADE